jgi:beta-1,4-N-acetylglucosaminyltransferase
MIFVTVGIGGSDEIMREVDEIASKSNEEFVAVIGKTRYVPRNCRWMESVVSIVPYVKRARIVITHGGAGTIFESLNAGKRIIAIAKKHADNHQTDIVDGLSEMGYIIKCANLELLESCIKSRKVLKKYVRPKSQIATKILEFIEREELAREQ